MIDKNNFIGLSGFVWWFGVVEATDDPIGLGRCRVRIHGWHTDNKALLKTTDLPWAHPIIPLTTPYTFSCPNVGDWIFGFFADGENAQYPYMLGIIPGFINRGK